MKKKYFIVAFCIAASTIIVKAQAQENGKALKTNTKCYRVSMVMLRYSDAHH